MIKKSVSMIMIMVICMVSMIPIPAMAASNNPIKLNTYYYIASALDTNQVIDVKNGSHSNGANIQLYKRNGSNAQLFSIQKSGEDGYYYLVNKGSGKVLDIEGGGTDCGTNVQLYEANDSQAQHWMFYRTSKNSSYLYIVAQCGKFLDVQNGSTKNGTNIWIYDGNRTEAQKFLLIPYVNTTYETVDLDFCDIESWLSEIEDSQRRISIGGAQVTNPSGNSYYNGRIITGMNVLEWKTIDVKIPITGTGNEYRWEKVNLPCKIQYELHTHNDTVKMWFDVSRFNFYQSCECGYHDSWTCEMPLPDLTSNTDTQTTKSVIDYIQPIHTVLYNVQ